MSRRVEQHGDELANWEQWPLAALFAANALNVFVLYVPVDEMPLTIQWLLPWVRVACGIAAALSLDGTLIAVTMGRRLGRTSVWSWATIVATGMFTAAVAWYVHHAVGPAAAVLFMAQAVILVLYGQHLAQPRKPLQDGASSALAVNPAAAAIVLARAETHEIPVQADYPAPVPVDLTDSGRLGACKHCGEMLTLPQRGAHGRNYRRFGRCVKL